jgi:hypothetical protein
LLVAIAQFGSEKVRRPPAEDQFVSVYWQNFVKPPKKGAEIFTPGKASRQNHLLYILLFSG